MLTPEYLSSISDDIVLLYEELLNSIIEDISRRIVKTGGVTETADWQAQMAQNSGALYDEIVKETAKTVRLSEAEVRRIFSEAQVESITFDNRIYSEAGLTPLEHLSPAALKVFNAGINKTNGLIRNLTKTTALETQKTYINACTLAEMQVESGAFSYQQAIRTAVRSAVKDGGFIHYPTGHRDRVDVAVRRAVLTGVSQTTGDVSLMNAQQLDCDLMEITAHGGARPSHAVWQGKIVSLSGRDGYLSLSDIGYGTGPGFKGWNCRHDWYPFFEGISERAYSDQQLKEFSDKKVVYNDEEIGYYEATQMQREMERRIRATRRELNGYSAAMSEADEGLKAEIQKDFDKAAVKLKRQEAAYKDFSYKTGIGTQNDRLQTIGFGKSVSQKAVWANKRETIKGLTMSAKNPIDQHDIDAIYEYISAKSYTLNEMLRSGVKLPDEYAELKRTLDYALVKLPNYNGTVYRSISSEYIEDLEAFYADHSVGNTVSYKAFTSASKEVYDETMDIQFVIKSKRGKDISKWNPNESEILFKRGTFFGIVERKGNTIYMEEL